MQKSLSENEEIEEDYFVEDNNSNNNNNQDYINNLNQQPYMQFAQNFKATHKKINNFSEQQLIETEKIQKLLQQKNQTASVTVPQIDFQKDYDIIGNIGSGSTGKVFLVLNKITQQKCALKVIEKHLVTKQQRKYSVIIELEIYKYFQKTIYIPRLQNYWEEKLTVNFLMEYLEHKDFKKYLEAHKKQLKIETIQFYAAEIALLIEFLHQNGIAHRDIKPQNFLLTKSRHLKVVDFGSATIFNPDLFD